MSRKPILERGPRLVATRGRGGDVGHQPVVLLTEREAAERCRYFDRGCANPIRAFQRWATRAGIPVKRIAGRRHYDARLLDAFIDQVGVTKRSKAAK